jgi:TP901 family phage tail tape measure protein
MGSDAPFEEIRSGFYGIVSAEKAAGREGKSFFDVLKEKTWYSNISSLATTFFSWYQIFNVFKEASNTVIELNTNITELAKVSEKTSSQIYDDFNSYAEIAKEVGGTISDTISATADWSRNGYDIEASKELSKAALIYKNVGDGIDIDEANEYLISTLRGFNLEAEQAMDIIDSINNVANNEPIDTAGIGEALQRSAAAFNAANTDLQESIALVTSTNSVLQSPDKVGSMWTTVSARIRGATTELEEAGEDTDGMVESTSKLQALIKGMTGFDILEEDGKTFKSIYDIIIGIGEEFQNLDDIDQASLLEALAGETLNCLKIWKHILKNIFNCKENLKLYATI